MPCLRFPYLFCFLLFYRARPSLSQFNDINKTLVTLGDDEKHSVISTEKFVKLTTKQGFIMNQVLAIYALDTNKIENIECQRQVEEFKNGLRAFRPWALKMFDSSSKLPSGLLQGNLMDFGSFVQCTQIHESTKSGLVTGKYCLIKVIPTLNLIKAILQLRDITDRRIPKIRIIVEKTMLRWAICVPQACSVNEIFNHFNRNIIELSQGLDVEVNLLEMDDCHSSDGNPSLELSNFFALFILILLPTVSLVCTAAITIAPKAIKNRFLSMFSLVANYKKIIAEAPSKELDCLHGLRFLSTCYVVIGHRYLMAMFFPVQNGLEILDWILNYSSTIIIGGTVCVDTFFMINGLLVSLSFFHLMTKNHKFNLLKFIIYRYLRITPSLAFVVLFYATLIQFLGSGPLWKETVRSHQKSCQDYWWSTLLHVQSYINPESLCIIQAWSLSCDMPYYYLSPLILYPLWKWNTIGYIIYVISYCLSIAINFYLAWINQYEGGMPITNQLLETTYFQKHYIAPHVRAAPYIIGLGLGYAIYKRQGNFKRIAIGFNLIGWLIALTVMIASVVGCHVFQVESHDFNRLDASLFLALSRSAWTFGLVWIVWSCISGQGGIVNYILTLHSFRVLGRVTYGIFLLHMIFQFLKSGANKLPIYFSNFNALYDSAADLMFMVIAGFMFTLFYELPLVNIANLLMKSKGARKVESQK